MRKYFIYDGQMKKGPFTLDELKTQSLKRESPIWYEDLQKWINAGDVEELNEFFIPKKIPTPLPKSVEISLKKRDELLNSFADANEVYSEPKRKSFSKPILIILIITGLIIAYYYYRKSLL